MPAMELIGRLQKAIFWEAGGYDHDGEITVAAAVEIDVRWQVGKRRSAGPKDDTVSYDAELVVDRVITVGSVVWKGSMDDLNDLADPTAPTDLYDVVDYTETSDIKNRNVRRTVLLMRRSDDLPSLTV